MGDIETKRTLISQSKHRAPSIESQGWWKIILGK